MTDTVIRGATIEAIATNPQVGLSGVDNADVFLRRMPQEYRFANLPSTTGAQRSPDHTTDFAPVVRDILRMEPDDRNLIIPNVFYNRLAEAGNWVNDLAKEGNPAAQDLANLLSDTSSLIHEGLLGRYAAIRC